MTDQGDMRGRSEGSAKHYFTKGHKRGGCPRGKGRQRSFAQHMDSVLQEEQFVVESGKRHKMTKEEILARQVFANAVKGDPKACTIVMGVIRDRDAKLPPEEKSIQQLEWELEEKKSAMLVETFTKILGKEVETDEDKVKLGLILTRMGQVIEERKLDGGQSS